MADTVDDTPSVSVVIPALNAAHTLPRQLTALAGQVDAPRFEVVVADNGSSDGTRSVVTKWSGRLRVRFVDCSEHRGASFARNAGAVAAVGEQLLFCDADDVVSPRWVAVMSAALDQGRVLVSGPIVRVTESTPVGWVPTDTTFGTEPATYMGVLPCALAGSLAIWRADFLGLGGYDNSYRGGCEDVDFSWRAQMQGLKLVVPQGCVLYYLPRATAGDVFRQERHYTSQGILLWMRFRDQPHIHGPSLRWTLGAVVRSLVAVRPRLLVDAESRYTWARRLGSDLGSLEGHLRYRVLKRVPARQLLSVGGNDQPQLPPSGGR